MLCTKQFSRSYRYHTFCLFVCLFVCLYRLNQLNPVIHKSQKKQTSLSENQVNWVCCVYKQIIIIIIIIINNNNNNNNNNNKQIFFQDNPSVQYSTVIKGVLPKIKSINKVKTKKLKFTIKIELM